MICWRASRRTPPGHAYVNVYILWVDYYHTLLAEIYVYVHVYVYFYFFLF